MAGARGRAVLALRGGEHSREFAPFAIAVQTRGSIDLFLFEEEMDALWLAGRIVEQARVGEASSRPAVAVAVGRAIEESGRLEGRPVDECLALLRSAQPGQALATDAVLSLEMHGVQSRRLPSPPPLAGARELIWGGVAATAPALPPILELAERGSRFCGRDQDLRALERAWDGALASGGRALAIVSGEPGVGKTRLLAKLATTLAAKGAPILYGRCLEETSGPYGPIAEMFAGLGATEDWSEEISAVREAEGSEPAGEVGSLARSRRQKIEIEDAVARLVAEAASEAPLALLIDDLHWADQETMRLIGHLLESPEPIVGVIVLALRGSEVEEGGTLARALQRMRRRPGSVVRELSGLARDELAALASSFVDLDDAGTEDVVHEIHSETGGNPLFAIEMLRSLSESGQLDGAPRRGRRLELALPVTLVEAVRQRVERLGADASHALRFAAICGAEFDPSVVESSIGWKSERLGSALRDAERAGLLERRRGGALGFSHALVVRALVEDTSASARGRIHRRIAEALEAAPAEHRDVEALARHWLDAAPPDRGKAIAHSQAAARRALVGHRVDAARELYGAALRLHGDVEDRLRAELLLGLGLAERQARRPSFGRTLLDAARIAERLGEQELLRASVLANNREFDNAIVMVDRERVAMLKAAIKVTAEEDPAHPRLRATLAAEFAFSGSPRRIEISDGAMEDARRLGDEGTLASVLISRFITIWAPGSLPDRLASAEEAVRLADRVGDPMLQLQAIHWYAVALIETGDVAGGAAMFERENDLARRFGDPVVEWIALYDRANIAIVRDELESADSLASEAFQMATETAQPNATHFYGSQLSNIRFQQGRLGEMQGVLSRFVAGSPIIPAFRPLLSLASIEAGLRDQAQALLSADAADGFPFPQDLTWLTAHAIYAHVCAELGDREVAVTLLERLAPYRGEVVFTGSSHWGNVDHALGRLAGLLGRADAGELLERSCDRYVSMGAPVWLSRARVDAAREALASHREEDRERALSLLELAIEGAERHGAESILRRAKGLRESARAGSLQDVLGHERLGRSRQASSVGASPRRRTLRAEGDVWRIAHDGGTIHVRDSIGFHYVAELVANPGVEFHAPDLQARAAGVAVGGSERVDGLSVRRAAEDGELAVLDQEAKRAYRARIEDLRAQIQEGEEFNDPERVARSREELSALTTELAGAVGLGGRDRKLASSSERARVNVTRAIRRAISKLRESEPVLAAELDRSVRTGTFCAYEPIEDRDSQWTVERS